MAIPSSPSKSSHGSRRDIVVGRTRSPQKEAYFSRHGARVTSRGSIAASSALALLSSAQSSRTTTNTNVNQAPPTASHIEPSTVRNPFVGDPIKLAPPTQSAPAAPSIHVAPAGSVAPATPLRTASRAGATSMLVEAKDDDWLDIDDERDLGATNDTTKLTTFAPDETDPHLSTKPNATGHTSASFAGFSPSNTSRRQSRWSWYRSYASSSPNDSIDASSFASDSIQHSPYNTQLSRRHLPRNIPPPSSGGSDRPSSAPTSSKGPSFWLNPQFPALMAMYLQLGFNAGMVFLLSYAISVFYHSIRRDVNMKIEEYSMEVVAKMAQCSQEYLRNNCEPSRRVPALDAICAEWEHCMNQDPRAIGRAKVSAETFGEIVESFLKPIGFKSMLFLVFLFAGSFILVNMVFSSRIGPRFSAAAAQPQQASAPPPPPQMQAVPEQMYTPNTYARAYGSPLHTPNAHTPYYLGYPASSGRFSHSPGYYMSPRASASVRAHRRLRREMDI